MTTLRLPRTMYDDDLTDEVGLLKIQHETDRFIWVDTEDPALGEINLVGGPQPRFSWLPWPACLSSQRH